MQSHFKHVIPHTCIHVAGLGGSKAAVRQIMQHKDSYKFFVKSDVKSYYASMDHGIIYKQCAALIQDNKILNLIWRFLKHTITYGGLYWDVDKGISLGFMSKVRLTSALSNINEGGGLG